MLTEVDKSAVKVTRPKSRENYHFARRTVEEFVDSGYECAKVEGWPRKIQHTTQYSYLSDAIKDLGFKDQMVARVRGESVYIVWIGEDDDD